jgi:hypothetical protein
LHSQTIVFDYTEQKHFGLFLASDLHIGSKAHNREQLKYEFDRALALGYMIAINGDWGEFIISGDRKRYHPSADKYSSDNPINDTIDEAFEFLKPYAKNIIFIGCGNHEVSMSKFHATDVTRTLIALLNHATGSDIKHGQYRGFLRLMFTRGGNGGNFSYDLCYNHGQGGRGFVGLDKMMLHYQSDFVWQGHSHTKAVLPCENIVYMNRRGDITTKERKAIITGAYVKPVNQYDATETGYKISYGEECMRGIQSTGGYFLTFDCYRTENDAGAARVRVVEP